MNDSNFRYTEEQTQADPQHQQPERRTFNIKFELNATDIMKIIALIGGIVITCLLIICAYSAGFMIGALILIGFLAFLALMLKSME